jgi:hypothetical protein
VIKIVLSVAAQGTRVVVYRFHYSLPWPAP